MKRPKWPVVRLGTIAEFRNGLNYNKGNFGAGLKVINVKDFQDRLIADFTRLDEINPDGLVRDECFIRDGDILFVRSNGNRELIGRSMLVTGVREQISYSAFSIKARFTTPNALPRFYAYLFRTSLIRSELSNRGGGTNISNLNQDILNSLEVSLPPLSTQRKIAGVLSAYDDLIENNTRRIAILEEMAQAIYREWFVNFRFPGHEEIKLINSPLGKIPEGWKKPFAEYVDFLEGPGLRRWQYRDEGIPFLNIRTIGNNDIDLSKCQYVDPAEVEQKYSHFLLRPLDHIVSSSGTIGRIATVQQHHLPLMLNTSIIRMAPKNRAVGRWQLKHFLQSPYFQDQIVAHASGVAQMNYGPSHLKLMWIITPDEATGIAYEQHVEPLESLLCSLVKKNTNLRQTRDLLLPKLMSGQLDVEELDIDGESPIVEASS